MSKVAIIEYGKVTYRGNLPNKFQNSNMNVTGLRKSEGNWESLNAKGIFELEEITPEDVPATHKIDGFTDDRQADKVIQTWNIREKTQEEIDVEAARKLASDYRQKIEGEKERLAIESLVGKGELPVDYK